MILKRKPDPLHIMAYSGFANGRMLTFYARVLEIERLSKKRHAFGNLANFIRRMESDEKHHAPVRASIPGNVQLLRSDDEGYITYRGPHKMVLPTEEIQFHVPLELMDHSPPVHTNVEINKAAREAPFGVISDLDDTVLRTGVKSAVKMFWNSAFRDSSQRLSFDGASDFYRLLRLGPTGKNQVPFFYVSNSPWNIYDYLSNFLSLNLFPKGSILLRDFGLDQFRRKKLEDKMKYRHLKSIFTMYPDMQFVLIGDAAEHDTELYLKAAKDFPNQVRAIYIRSVSNKRSMKRVRNLLQNELNVELFMFHNSHEALAHARDHGLIHSLT